MKITLILLAALLLAMTGSSACPAATLHVDDNAPNDPGPNNSAVSDPLEDGSPAHPYDSIQQAVNAAASGDTVRVAEGVYSENVTISGKSLVLAGAGPGRSFLTTTDVINKGCVTTESLLQGRISGFTIQQRTDRPEIAFNHSSLTLSNCVIRGGSTFNGLDTIGIRIRFSDMTITNCTLVENNMALYPTDSTVVLTNSIFWHDPDTLLKRIALASGTTLTVSYTNLPGGQAAISVRDSSLVWGSGNVDTDPLFADPAKGDYHLRSVGGRWDPAADGGAGAWVADAVHSPCIDAGDPASDFSGESAPNGSRVNMGAFGGSVEASKSSIGQTFTLTVQSEGIDAGQVTGFVSGSLPLRIEGIPANTQIDLIALPASDRFLSKWTNWAGKTIGMQYRLSVVMDSNKWVVAVYTPVTEFYVNDAVADGSVPAGDNRNTGLSAQGPMASINQLLLRYPSIGSECTVKVSPGTYAENIVAGSSHSGLVLQGADRASTTIVGSAYNPCLSVESWGSGMICGLAFAGGNGIRIVNSSITIMGNTIRDSQDVAGMSCNGGMLVIADNTVSGSKRTAVDIRNAEVSLIGNSVSGNLSTGIMCSNCTVLISNNVVSGNCASGASTGKGGGINCDSTDGTIIANTVSRNSYCGIYSSNCQSLEIIDNTVEANSGGGVWFAGYGPTILNNRIIGNSGTEGGGIHGDASGYKAGTAVISGNLISGNRVEASQWPVEGGGISCTFPGLISNNRIIGNQALATNAYGAGMALSAAITATNNLIVGNSAAGSATNQGGGVYCSRNSTLDGNTIAGNSAAGANGTGGGICLSGSPLVIRNCIVFGNLAARGQQIARLYANADPIISYSDIAGGKAGIYRENGSTITWGLGNIDADPLFASPANGDYHLMSRYGRRNPATSSWVIDAVTSPCIDAGDPASPYASEPQPNFGRVNMGACGNTAEASKSGWNIPGDATDDCR
ncbi:MAG TPA: right-handed parallel beta-helix repeat-containing protein, partial [Hyphomicrobiaceae bacterium]|nr:right-handed parallel beta-helix repeat-containing protein [Hyphomicrobiaceae bacterium]